jgi:hypothetical protein
MKIYAPIKHATGVWCSVHFRNGVGETDNPHLIEWFKSHGYKIEESPIMNEVKLNEFVENDEVDLESMTPIELREWAKANGLGSKIKNIRNKEKLLEVIRG